MWPFGDRKAANTKAAASDVMLSYFLSTLDVRTRRLEPTIGNDPFKSGVLADVRSSLDRLQAIFTASSDVLDDAAWNEAYRLERLLVLIEPSEYLWTELRRRVAEAAEEGLASAPRLASAMDASAPFVLDSTKSPPALKPDGEPILRSLLLDTLEEVHYAAQKKFYSRPIQRQATYRIVYLGLFAFLLFVLPYIGLYALVVLGHTTFLSSWSWLPLYSSLTAGLFGALFSRLLYLQSNWNALSIGGTKDAADLTSILLRGCVGMTGAVIVSFFLQSGVIGGSLFPEFATIGLDETSYPKDVLASGLKPLHIIYPSKALALLVVWSFLAGFSERLVPSILQETETTIGKKSA